MRLININGNKIRLHASSQAADIVQEDGSCPVFGRHQQRFRRRYGGRIPADSFMDQRSQTHFLEHIEVVVACRPVSAQ
ncbi:hypothetical protein D3C71_1998830 [compost metagenome]